MCSALPTGHGGSPADGGAQPCGEAEEERISWCYEERHPKTSLFQASSTTEATPCYQLVPVSPNLPPTLIHLLST